MAENMWKPCIFKVTFKITVKINIQIFVKTDRQSDWSSIDFIGYNSTQHPNEKDIKMVKGVNVFSCTSQTSIESWSIVYGKGNASRRVFPRILVISYKCAVYPYI